MLYSLGACDSRNSLRENAQENGAEQKICGHSRKPNLPHRKIFQKHIIGKVNGNLINPINKSINGKVEFFPFMENLE